MTTKSPTPAKRRTLGSFPVDIGDVYVGYVDGGRVDIDLDEIAEDLEDAGWHHKNDCTGAVDPDAREILDTRQALLDWHDAEHGLTDWVTCRRGPCEVIPREFKDGR